MATLFQFLLHTKVHWVVSEDRGPNGASGKGKFQPAFSVGLVVTLYKVCSTQFKFQLYKVL